MQNRGHSSWRTFFIGVFFFLLTWTITNQGCRIIDPGYGDGQVVLSGPTISLGTVEAVPSQEARISGENFELLLPPNALARPGHLQVYRTLRQPEWFSVPASWTLLSNIYTITLQYTHPTLEKAASIRIPFDPSLLPTGLTEQDIFVAYFEPLEGLHILTPSVDLAQGMTKVSAYHLSEWAVLARPRELLPKTFPQAPVVVANPLTMASINGRFPADLLLNIGFELPSGAIQTTQVKGWYLLARPRGNFPLVLAAEDSPLTRRPLKKEPPLFEPIDLHQDPYVFRSFSGPNGTFRVRFSYLDQKPEEAPPALLWRLAARDPLGFLYERE